MRSTNSDSSATASIDFMSKTGMAGSTWRTTRRSASPVMAPAAPGADEERQLPEARVLHERQVETARRLLAQVGFLPVLHDADDLDVSRVSAAEPEAATDRDSGHDRSSAPSLSLITATFGARAPSASVNSRPATTGIPMVRK